MKYFWGLALVQSIVITAFGQSAAHQFTPSNQGSSVTFSIKNFGFNSTGSFSGLQGAIVFDPQHPETAAFDVSLDAASINTDNTMRDEHLKKEAYFDVATYPRIRFLSTAVSAADKEGHFIVTGKLTIKDSTKIISFPFLATPAGDDYIFKGDFTINRRDFDVGGASTLSNNLTVSLAVLARK